MTSSDDTHNKFAMRLFGPARGAKQSMPPAYVGTTLPQKRPDTWSGGYSGPVPKAIPIPPYSGPAPTVMPLAATDKQTH